MRGKPERPLLDVRVDAVAESHGRSGVSERQDSRLGGHDQAPAAIACAMPA